jgi:hypothetical protein
LSLVIFPRQIMVDTGGIPRVGCKAYCYLPTTTTLITTYTTSALSIANANPLLSVSSGYFPATYIDPAVNPSYKLVIKDSSDVTLYTEDNIPSSPLFTDQTDDEEAAGVTPTNYNLAPFVRGRYSTFGDWKLACDQAGAEGKLDDDYAITATTTLPNKCDFAGFKITGAFYTDHVDRTRGGYVKEWVAKQPRVRNCFFCQYTGVNTDVNVEDTGFITIDGGGGGTAWCSMQITYTRKLELKNDNGYVNFNRFHDGIARYIHLTGGSADMHANEFCMLDFTDNGAGSDWGFLQDDSAYQVNFIRGCYYEAGSTIVGNVHLIGWHGDATGMPAVGRRNHIFGGTGTNSRLGADFLALSVRNLVQGGEWDMLDTSAKPIGLSQSGGASVSVQTDTTEPSGCGKRYQADFADAFDSFQITLQPSGSDRFGIALYYKSTADFAAVESNDGSGAISHTVSAVVVDVANNWKLLRIAGPASKTATTSVTLYGYGGLGGATKTMSIGGIFAGSEKAARLPQKNAEVISGTFLATLTGVSGTVQGNVTYERCGNRVSLSIPSLTGISNTTACTITGMPTTLYPTTAQGMKTVIVTNNSVDAVGRVEVDTSGVLVVYPTISAAASGWTAAGTKTVTRFNYDYLVS